jgi:chitin synthase
VLNLNLLNSLPAAYFSYSPDGLIASMMANKSAFVGKDITMHINTNINTQWKQDAKCLSQTIRVGALDTLSIGCMASEIVLYVSLVVILGVITVKFALAVIFGWFLSWKLGNFKEGESYASRMKREAEIENWASNMQAGAPLPKPRVYSTYFGNNSTSNRRKSLFPQTSRYTQPMPGSTRFDHDKNNSTASVFKTPNR